MFSLETAAVLSAFAFALAMLMIVASEPAAFVPANPTAMLEASK